MQDNRQKLIEILTAVAMRQFPIECATPETACSAFGRNTHFHHCPELRFILIGSNSAMIPDHAVLLPSYVLHDRIPEEKLNHCFSLWLENEAVICNYQGVTQALKIDNDTMQRLAVELGSVNCFLDNYQKSIHDTKLQKIHLNNLLHTVCSAVVLALTQNEQDSVFSSDPVEQARRIIRLQYSDPELSIASIAKMLRFNANYLSGIFRKNTGETLRGYLIRFRLEQAVAMLQTRRFRIKDIASMCGFRNQYYFANVFHAHFHTTPSKYIGEIA